jgi:hypothetical protein
MRTRGRVKGAHRAVAAGRAPALPQTVHRLHVHLPGCLAALSDYHHAPIDLWQCGTRRRATVVRRSPPRLKQEAVS